MKKIWRIIFSRYFFSGVIILCEFSLIFAIIMFASSYSMPAFIIMVLINILAMISLINRDANPEYKVSWLVVLTLMPFFGVAIYALFYSRKLPKKERRRMKEITSRIREASIRGSGEEEFLALCETDQLASGKALSIMNDDSLAEVYSDTVSTYYSLGEDMFEAMLSDIGRAEKFIFLEYFIICEGAALYRLENLLLEKSKEGVEVRILYDDIGCMRTLPSNYDRLLREKGISVVRFSPVSPRISNTHNNRDHRKICIVDGCAAYTGGINIADEYINEKKRFGHWKDGGIKIEGAAVEGFIKLFLSLWDFASGENSDVLKYLKTVRKIYGDGGYYIPFGSGPLPSYQRPSSKGAFMNIINQAKEYVYITTPYLIIDYDLTEALRGAAQRGVDVRIITPAIADKRIVKVMTKSAYPYLLLSGVRIYEYTPGFIHEKNLISDDLYAIVGTVNFDYRSLVHHYEDAVWIYNSQTVEVARDEFFKTISVSSEIDKKGANLSPRERLIRNLIRMFAPLL